jgi:hypothetical protein
MDHPRGLEGDFARRLGRIDGERLEEVAGVAHEADAMGSGADHPVPLVVSSAARLRE